MRTYKSVGYKKRQYEDIARILGEAKRSTLEGHATLIMVEDDFIRLFSDDNARFDRQRFTDRVAEYAEGKR